MKVYLNSITGIDDAIISTMMSKKTWTREKENHVRYVVSKCTDRCGFPVKENTIPEDIVEEFNKNIDILIKWGWAHITLLRFIDLSITVDGLHRAGQDDWDAHAMRYNNRIIRSSTRIKKNAFGSEMSDYYKDKIIPTDIALELENISVPDKIKKDGKFYIKTTNGYILEEYKDNPDVQRGLYMLSIPSNFIFKVNLTEFAHVYKERRREGSANPEVKECCEAIAVALESKYPKFNRELLLKIKN